MAKTISRAQLDFLRDRFTNALIVKTRAMNSAHKEEITKLFKEEKKKVEALYAKIKEKADKHNEKAGQNEVPFIGYSFNVPISDKYSTYCKEFQPYHDEFNALTLRLVMGEDISKEFQSLLEKLSK